MVRKDNYLFSTLHSWVYFKNFNWISIRCKSNVHFVSKIKLIDKLLIFYYLV